MKFLCDRCKTRYAIGDDRVRGKILKIRCKNCANVITVREGMSPDPEPVDPGMRQKNPTTSPPEAMLERPEPSARTPAGSDPARERASAAGAPAAASDRASAGVAAGKRTGVGGGPATGLAGDPGRRPTASAGRAAEPSRSEPQRAEPQRNEPVRREPVNALGAAFASAMAKPPPVLDEEWYVSIDGEQEGPFSLAEAQQWVTDKAFDAELYCWSEGFDDWLPVDKVSHFRGLRKRPPPPATPPPLPRLGGASRASVAPPTPTPTPTIEDEPKPLFAATMASLERGAPGSSPSLSLPSPAPRATAAAGVALRSNGASTAAAPLPAERSRDPSLAPPGDELLAARPAKAGPAAAPVVSDAASDFGDGDDGELAIGEVSRVVKLGDIVRSRSTESSAARRAAAAPAAVGRASGSESSLRASFWTGTSGGGAAPETAATEPSEGDPGITVPPVAKSHRRGLITLLSVAVVLVLGVIGAVVLLVTTSDDPASGRLGSVRDIDTSRPEDPITHRPLDPAASSPAPSPRSVPRARVATTTSGSSHEPETPAGNPLNSEEIEEIARKYQEPTQRCYMRAQRGVDSILVGDVKKIGVMITINGDGMVSDIQLSDHATDNLGKCLTGMMRGWRFRPSAGGTFKFSLNFVGG